MQLGKTQILTIVKQVDFGVYLAEDTSKEERVLLPRKQVPEGVQTGDELEVFLYKDSQDRIIATTIEPKLKLGEVARLTVKEVAKIGAFLDWGLEKDLFLPFRQQTRKVQAGDNCLAALYIDKSERLCATMNVYDYLRTDSPYENPVVQLHVLARDVLEAAHRNGIGYHAEDKIFLYLPALPAHLHVEGSYR